MNDINQTIESAKKAIKKHSYNVTAYITESKLNKKSRKTFLGFFFSGDKIDVGSIIKNSDGSFSKVVAYVCA